MRTTQLLRFVTTALAVAILSSFAPLFAQDGSSVLKEVVFQNISKPRFKQYRFEGYPVSNYGILSAYSTHKKEKKMALQGQSCTTFVCLGVSEPTEPEKLLHVDPNFVTVGHGAPLAFKGEEQKKRFINITVPIVAEMLGASATFSKDSKANVELTAARLYLRDIRPAAYYESIVALQQKQDATAEQRQLVNLWKAGRLLVVTNDVVVDSMTLKVKLEKEAGGKFEAEVGKKLAEGSKGKFEYKKESDTEYTLTITEPLILAKYGRNLCHWKLEPNPCGR